MAGVGVRLNKIFQKNTITTNLIGIGYSAVISILPMVLVIGAIMVMSVLLDFDKVGYATRELFSCTILYIFIFALLSAAPFNAVLSRYLSDVIYWETYEDIMPCFYIGLLLNLAFGCLFGIPFCAHEYFVGHVSWWYVFTGFVGFIALILVFYTMLYLSICKDYKKISAFFTIGMTFTVLLGVLLVKGFHWEVTYSMLVAMDAGFMLIAALEMAVIRSYFRKNSGNYRKVLSYFRKYWKLIFINFLYTLGLYIHNFVFWTTPGRMVVANSFVCMQPYDMASCLAMFTNLSASAIFISRVEMRFHDRYKAYSEAVIGGRGMDIENAKSRMFSQLAQELMNLVRIQFILSVVIFLLFVIFLPQMGFGGLVMWIYPCLAVGYFILFLVYSAILFLYYFNDLSGALVTTIVFCGGIFLGSIVATHLSEIWYGIGVVIGSFLAWCVVYFRLRWLERNLDVHVFCEGNILKKKWGTKPSGKVFDRYAGNVGREES